MKQPENKPFGSFTFKALMALCGVAVVFIFGKAVSNINEINQEKARNPQPAVQSEPGGPAPALIEGRSAAEMCYSTSPECQRWTELARKCAENERKREQGFMGTLPPYCSEMESYREQVTGIADSSSPGAYRF